MQRILRPGIVLIALTMSACSGPATSTPPPNAATLTASPSPSVGGGLISDPTSEAAPPGRMGAAMAFDPQSHSLIVFGGQAAPGSRPTSDTWSWDGHLWTRLHPTNHPPALSGAGLVLEPGSGHLLLVSGANQVGNAGGMPTQQGMWSWDGTDWTRTGDNPIQDGQVNLAADPPHHQVLLDAAGDTGAGASTPPPLYSGGAYVWNGSTWSKAAAHLTGAMTFVGSHGAGIAFDPIGNRVIEFGGVQQGAFGDTLAWDGSTWTTLLAQTQPKAGMPPPGTALAATDSTNGHLILVAGYVEDPKLATTWMWNGALWQRLRGTEPPALDGAALAYDPVVGGLVLFGGQPQGGDASATPTNAMYFWHGNGWQLIPAPSA